MCGIAGILQRNPEGPAPSSDELLRMASALRHRGPDEFGLYRDQVAGLAHARLSIIDLSSGQQPMGNEDGSLQVVFNGEIFNYVELRDDLLAAGHLFRTRSDTEVILHAWEQWREEAFARFNGQFAIALWDRTRGQLVLARDWAGVRPLHLCEHQGRLYFASEVKAIFAADPSIPRAFDPAGLAQTFTFWAVVPPRSVFRGVSEIEPGHVRIYDRRGVRDRAFRTLQFPVSKQEEFRGSVDDAAEAVLASLEEATRLRMVRADVPVGSYLSGGLDSSVIAALGLRANGTRFRTFSLRFEDAEYDETGYQREMAAFLGSEHSEIVVSRRHIAEVFPEVVWHTERPILRTAPAPLLLLSRLVREAGMKVVLTGEGADEVFAGYDLFREGKVRRFWARSPNSAWRPRLIDRLYPYLARSPVAQQAMARRFFGRDLHLANEPGFAHGTRWRTTAAIQRMFSRELQREVQDFDVIGELIASLPEEFRSWSPLAQDQYLEIRTLLHGYLMASQGDRMLMANSVEGRFPFLDPNVLALANSLPSSCKLRVLDEKHVLKRAARELVPPSILRRKKQPYRAPDALSFVMPGTAEWIDDLLSERAVRDAGVFEPGAVAALWGKCKGKAGQTQFSNTDNMALVGVISTHLLHEQMVRNAPAPGAPVRLTTRVDRVEEQ